MKGKNTMDFLKSVFPFSFREKKEVKDLVVTVIIYVIAAIICSVIGALIGLIPVVGSIIGILFWIIDVYFTAGIVLTFLHYFKVIK